MSAIALADAGAPPERRGIERDRVRLLVGRGDGRIEHTAMRELEGERGHALTGERSWAR